VCRTVEFSCLKYTLVLCAGSCFSAVTSKLENLVQSPDLRNSDKSTNGSVGCQKLSSASQRVRRTSVRAVIDSCLHRCPYVCCFCCKRYTTSTSLLRHLRHEHNSTLPTTDKLPAVKVVTKRRRCNTSNAGVRDLEPLSCRSCSRQFRTRAKLQSHMRLCHKAGCPWSAHHSKSVNELRRPASVDDVQAQCCGLSLSPQPSDVSQPERSGTETGAELEATRAGSLRCKECGAGSFKTWRSLMVHRRTRHSAGRLPHTCPRCPRQFLYASDLRKHERRHTGQRPHVCTECGKGFYDAADLEVHGRRHRGDAPLTCGVCHKWMSSMTGLRAHMRIHRADAPASTCAVCDKPFSYLSSLRAHMRRQHAARDTSEGWRCEHCLMDFSSHSMWSAHCCSSTSHLCFISLIHITHCTSIGCYLACCSRLDREEPHRITFYA